MAFSFLRSLLALFFFLLFNLSDGENLDQHDVNPRYYITQTIRDTTYLYVTATAIYTPPPLRPGSNYASWTIPSTHPPQCEDPNFDHYIEQNTTSCTSEVCIRPKAAGDRNFTHFIIHNAGLLYYRQFPTDLFNHWYQGYSTGLKYTYSSNPYQPPKEWACHTLTGVPIESREHTVYVADFYGNYCTETIYYPISLDFVCRN